MIFVTIDERLNFFNSSEFKPEKHKSDFIDNFLYSIDERKFILKVDDKYSNKIIEEISPLIRNDHIEEIIERRKHKIPKISLYLLQIISQTKDSKSSDKYLKYFIEFIQQNSNSNASIPPSRILKPFANFIIKNRFKCESYTFLRFNISSYKIFLLFFFQKVGIDNYLFDHVQNFIDFFSP